MAEDRVGGGTDGRVGVAGVVRWVVVGVVWVVWGGRVGYGGSGTGW